MKCARCDDDATEGPYCSYHAPQTNTLERTESDEKSRKDEIEKQRQDREREEAASYRRTATSIVEEAEP